MPRYPAGSGNAGRHVHAESRWLSDTAPLTPRGAFPRGASSQRTASSRSLSSGSIILDTELWSESKPGRKWSCSFLAAVWQLVRLGFFSDVLDSYLEPGKWDGGHPASTWSELAPIIRINDHAAPFQAARTVSILASRYLPVEAAVRAILKQVELSADSPRVADQTGLHQYGNSLAQVTSMINYVFINMR